MYNYISYNITISTYIIILVSVTNCICYNLHYSHIVYIITYIHD